MEVEEEKMGTTETQNDESTVAHESGKISRTNPTEDKPASSHRPGHEEDGAAEASTRKQPQSVRPTNTPAIPRDTDSSKESTRNVDSQDYAAANHGRTASSSPLPESKASLTAGGTSNMQTGNDQIAVDKPKHSLNQSNASDTVSDAPSRISPPVVAPPIFTPPASKIARKAVSFSEDVTMSSAQRSNDDPSGAPMSQTTFVPSMVQAKVEPSLEHTIQRLRAPLVETYAPYIQPTDTCLEDARQRLRTALEQTRFLRENFTERVYEKYRVLLRPVPKSVEAIVNPILADPEAAKLRIEGKIRLLKEEKDVEKKEAQKFASKAAAASDGSSTAASRESTAEALEQMAYIGAGLSLVVLPEEDVGEEEINIRGFVTRGPTNPETGQRVPGISAAACASAEMILDRTRRSAALRVERQRRRQIQILTGETPEDDEDSSNIALANLHLLSEAPVRSITTKTAHARGQKIGRRVWGMKVGPSSQSVAGIGKLSRGQKMPLSTNALLSLNPNSEEIRTDGKRSAATAALISRGVGVTNPKSILQRWRHPHPESALGQQSIHAPVSANMTRYASLALPQLLVGRELRDVKPVSVLDQPESSSESAKEVIQQVLRQFSPKVFEAGESAASGSQSSTPNVQELSATISSHQLHAAEISLLHELRPSADSGQQAPENDAQTPRIAPAHGSTGNIPGQKTQSTTERPDESGSNRRRIDPVLAFSVMHALGLIQESRPENNMQVNKDWLAQFRLEVFRHSSAMSDSTSSSRIDTLYKLITARKRPFSETAKCNTTAKSTTDTDGHSPDVGHLPSSTATITSGDTVTDDNQEPERKRQRIENQNLAESAEARDPARKDECPVVSVRGGGEFIVEESDAAVSKERADLPEKDSSADQLPDENDQNESLGGVNRTEASSVAQLELPRVRSSSAPPLPSEVENTFRMGASSLEYEAASHEQGRAIWDEHSLSMLESHLRSQSAEQLGSAYAMNGSSPGELHDRYSPPRSVRGQARSASNLVRSDRERLSYHSSQLQQHVAAPVHHLPAHVQLSATGLPDYYGLGQSPHGSGLFSTGPDWPSLGAVDLLSTHPSLTGFGLNPVSQSARERAARALLLREQQTAAAAAHAIAAHRDAAAAAISPQQAALISARSTHAERGAFGQPPRSTSERYSSATAAQASTLHLSREGSAVPRSRSRAVSAPAASASPDRKKAKKQSPHLSSLHSRDRQLSSGGREGTDKRKPCDTAERPSSEKKQVIDRDSNQRDIEHVLGKSTPSQPKEADPPASSAPLAPIPNPHSTNPGNTQHKADGSVSGRHEQAPNSISTVSSQRIPPIPSTEPNPLEESKTEPSHLHDKRNATDPSATVNAGADETSKLAVTGGMQFYVPATPTAVSTEAAGLILKARFHDASKGISGAEGAALIEFLASVGAAVPIPKAVVANPLKERLNSPGIKNQIGSGSPTIPRDVVTATILVWLWVQHKKTFQRAFAKSGRIDVDPQCKWVIQAAVDAGVRALTVEIAEAVASGDSFASSGGVRSKTGTVAVSSSFEVFVASAISRALMKEYFIDQNIDLALPHFRDLVQLLDECRMIALEVKSRERALLAALISRRASMSESFSHAYVSAMVRAGEALGHKELFDVVQDDETKTSTMIPYDIFADETGAWEDPCRAFDGFTPNLTGDELVRRAHARAMIQKSLKKLQDRHNIKGGISQSGPYADPSPTSSTDRAASPTTGVQTSSSLQRGLKRKSSFASSDASFSSASMAIYNPTHYSSPLFWDVEDVENKPYGNHTRGFPRRSLSLGRLSFEEDESGGHGKRRRLVRTPSLSIPSIPREEDKSSEKKGLLRSTEEIKWEDVAMIFQPVELPNPPPSDKPKDEHAVVPGADIIAPFCRKLDSTPPTSDDELESDEDLSDEAVLARHRVVLDRMKEKLDRVVAARKQSNPQRARGRPAGSR